MNEKIGARANAAQINAIKPGTSERLVGDTMVPNLFLVISPKGRKTWRWQGRTVEGKQRKLPLGTWPAFGLAEARTWAAERNEERERGHDPVALIAAAVAAKAREESLTVRSTHAAYIRHKRSVGEALRSMHDKERLMSANVFPKFGERPIGAFSKANIREILGAVRDRGSPVAANRLLTELKTFLSWCDQEDYVEFNVAASFKKTIETGYRRHTEIEEMAYIWRASATLPDEARDAFRLILLTGCRRMEAVGARSDEYRDGQWTIARERSKNRLPCILPLPATARAIFERRSDLEFVFHCKPRVDTFQKQLLALRLAADAVAGRKLESWDLHGCRHGVRTALRGQRLCTKEIAERIINHSSGGIDERYDHNLYLDEKREALERWEARLLSEVAKQEGTNIVMLREAG